MWVLGGGGSDSCQKRCWRKTFWVWLFEGGVVEQQKSVSVSCLSVGGPKKATNQNWVTGLACFFGGAWYVLGSVSVQIAATAKHDSLAPHFLHPLFECVGIRIIKRRLVGVFFVFWVESKLAPLGENEDEIGYIKRWRPSKNTAFYSGLNFWKEFANSNFLFVMVIKFWCVCFVVCM